MPIQVYKYKTGDKEHGVLKTLKDGVNFEEYVKRHNEKEIQVKKVRIPSVKTIKKNYEEYGTVSTPDGCEVEADGVCEHGYPSWLKIVGMI